MNTFITNKIFNMFIRSIELSEVDAIKLKYMIEVITNEFIKMIIFFTVFYIFNAVSAFVYCMIAIAIIRPLTGGFHTKTFFGCLIFSGSFLGACMLLIKSITLSPLLLLVLSIFNLLILGLFAPIVPKQRPKYSEYKKGQSKLISMMIVVIHFGLFLSINNPYFEHAIWVITLQSIQLLIAIGGIHFENTRKIKSSIKISL